MSHAPLAEPLLEHLLDDAVLLSASWRPTSVAEAVEGHRDRLLGEHAHLMGPLLVPATLAEPFAEALTPRDDALRVMLVAPDGTEPGRHQLRVARDLLAEDERVAIVGVRIGVPPGPPAMMTAALLTLLDFTAPAWIEVTPGPDASEVLRGVATDGAEALTLMATRQDDDPALARLIRTLLDDDESFRVALAPVPAPLMRTDHRHGVLNLLAAVHAGVHGADAAELAHILAQRDLAPLASGLRSLGDTEAAVTRAYLASVEVTDVAGAVAELLATGLLVSDA
jgi:hypothetical protein